MARKLVKFVILFDNTNVLYFPGQFLSGRVIVELNDDTPALGLHFHVVGEGVVRLRNRKQDKNYERENYIDFRMRLLGEPGKIYAKTDVTPSDLNDFPLKRLGQPPLLLSPGIHSFPFKLGLPLGLPSTFFGKNGWVQYFCKAALREPNGLTHKNQQVFIVMNPIDLNSEPTVLAQPFRCDMEHKFGVSCLKSGSVLCRVVLNHGGYVPGEKILVSAIIRNRSKIHIRSTKASLRETIQYMVKNKVAHSETRELSSVKRGKIQSGEVDEWRNEQLFVPPLPPTNLRGCHIISVQYDVYFIIEPKGLEKEVKIQLPILLGTYPFQSDDFDSRKPEAHYPTTLPIFRPWLEHKSH